MEEGVGPSGSSAARQSLRTDQLGAQRLFYAGARQAQAQAIVEEAAKGAGIKLSDYVDDVVFTTGESPWFNIVNGRRTIALNRNTLRKTEAGRLITAIHELSHARHSAKLGHWHYAQMYQTMRGRIEVLVEVRALRTVGRILGGLSPQQTADSMRYIDSWLP